MELVAAELERGPAPQPVLLGREEVAVEVGAEGCDLAWIARTELAGIRDVGHRVRQRQRAGDEHADSERHHGATCLSWIRSQQQSGERGDDDGKERAVVDGGNHLQPDQQAGEETESHRALLDSAMDGPERERHPDRPLQLEVHEVLDAVWHERKDDSRHQRRVGIAGQMPHEHEHADPRRHNGGEQQDVVHEDRVDLGPEPRRRQQRLEQHRIGIGECPKVRMKDVGVEDVLRIHGKAVSHPREAPDAEQRIVVRRDLGAEVQRLGPRQQHGQRDQQRQRARERVPGHGIRKAAARYRTGRRCRPGGRRSSRSGRTMRRAR